MFSVRAEVRIDLCKVHMLWSKHQPPDRLCLSVAPLHMTSDQMAALGNEWRPLRGFARASAPFDQLATDVVEKDRAALQRPGYHVREVETILQTL